MTQQFGFEQIGSLSGLRSHSALLTICCCTMGGEQSRRRDSGRQDTGLSLSALSVCAGRTRNYCDRGLVPSVLIKIWAEPTRSFLPVHQRERKRARERESERERERESESERERERERKREKERKRERERSEGTGRSRWFLDRPVPQMSMRASPMSYWCEMQARRNQVFV
jgi:hypothetical protein